MNRLHGKSLDGCALLQNNPFRIEGSKEQSETAQQNACPSRDYQQRQTIRREQAAFHVVRELASAFT